MRRNKIGKNRKRYLRITCIVLLCLQYMNSYKNIAASLSQTNTIQSSGINSKVENRPRGSGSLVFPENDYFHFDMGTEKGVEIKGKVLNPFSFPRNNLLVENLNLAVAKWVTEMGLMEGPTVLPKITAARFSNLVAGPCSRLSLEKAIVNALFVAFLFFYDDRIDGMKQTLEYVKNLNKTLMKSLETPNLGHEDPLIRSFSSFGMSAREAGISLDGFSRSVKEYFLTAEEEVQEREDDSIPNLIVYMDRREISDAVYSVFELSTASYEIVIPEDLKTSKLVSSMTQHAVRAICVANDIYSYRKECKEEIPDNLVFIMQRTHNLDVFTALERTIDVHDTEIKRYLNHKKRLQDSYPDNNQILDRICELYEGWMDSNHDFSSTSKHYLLPST